MRQELAKRSLPDINSLYNDVEIAAKRNDLNILLNQAPRPEWVKKNKFANDTPYIPIQTIEYLLTAIFLNWKVEIKNVQVIANSVVVMVRLHYQDPTTENWEWQDGVGAAPIQTKYGLYPFQIACLVFRLRLLWHSFRQRERPFVPHW